MADQLKQFDIAVCIDSNDQYKTILYGGIVYQMKSRDLHFNVNQRYVKGDINVVNDSSNFVQEIDTERYINEYFKDSNNITNSFKNIVKIRLFLFKENCSTMWYQHVNKQKNLASDAVIIVNNKNQPIYILHDTYVNILEQSIKFKSFTPYQGNDIKTLNFYANKTKQFLIHNKWKININKKDKIFKHGICYNFKTAEAKNAFFNQSYDVALITNENNEMKLLLSDCIYRRNNNILLFQSHMEYKNGIYGKLKEYGELMKSLIIKEYRLENTKQAYKFNGCKTNKCLLFNIKDIEKWVEYMETQTNSFYDVGVITNTKQQQVYFLNKVHIDLLENTLNFGGYEEFAAKHHGLVNKFGKFMKKHELKGFHIENLPNDKSKGKLYTINCYLWDLNKPQTQKTQSQIQSDNTNNNNNTNKKNIKGKNENKNKNKKNKNKNKKNKNKNKELNKKSVKKNNKKIAKKKVVKKSNKKVNDKSVKKDKNNKNNKNNKYNKNNKNNKNNTVKRGNYNKHNRNISKSKSKSKPKYKANNSKKKYDKKSKNNTQKSNKKKGIKTDNKKDKKDKKKKNKKDKKQKRRKNSVLQPSILKKLERRNSRKNSISLTDNNISDNNMSDSNAPNTKRKTVKMLSINNYNVNNELKEESENDKKEEQNVSITTKTNNIKPKSKPKSPVYSPPKIPPKTAVITAQNNNGQKQHNNGVKVAPKSLVPIAPVMLDNNEVINDFDGIWNAYIQKYGFEPKNAYQLQSFSKQNGNIRSLSYKEVRQLLKERSK